jgi:cyclopropane fatty-acyl-phospholipid synthase-like methyltransferase
MTEPILDPQYWKQRLDAAHELHHAIFRCDKARWERIEDKHRLLLAEHIRPGQSVLDCGCGWGRLLTLLPNEWCHDLHSHYLGIDLSPDFINLALAQYGITRRRRFQVADLLNLPVESKHWNYDWAVLISIRPMIRRNLGDEAWDKMEKNIRKVANRLLYLEYDELCNGFVE